MKSNSPITFSVEKGFRFFDNGVSFFHYFMIQFEVPKTYINSKTYYFSLTDEQNNELYSKNIIIDLVNKRIITPNSHEDPLVEDSNNFYICLLQGMDAPEGFGEVIGGSEREVDYDTLLARIKEHNLPTEPFEWYLDLRKYGSVPHSGFGIGLERLTGWICGIRHIRETIPFPRLMGRLTP